MENLLDAAKDGVITAYGAPETRGLVIVTTSKRARRVPFCAWALDLFAGEQPQPNFSQLYVVSQLSELKRTRGLVTEQRQLVGATNMFSRRLTLEMETLPWMRLFNYAQPRAVRHWGEQFTKGMLNIVILDERSKGEMDGISPIVERLEPDFTLVIMNELVANSPWTRFGEPLVLRGTAPQP